jgi:hypothetical protein
MCRLTKRQDSGMDYSWLSGITAAVTGPPPEDYDVETRVIGGSG